MFKKIFKFLKDLLLPIECLGCHKENFWLCRTCLNSLKIYRQILPFTEPVKYLNGVISACSYDQPLLKNLIHAFKFNYLEELSNPLAFILFRFWLRNGLSHKFSDFIIIPVPLAKKRQLERVFNQADLIAKKLSAYLDLPYSQCLIRFKNTPHQVGLNKSQRQNNIKNCFRIIKPETIRGQKIILIDDVVTTGSTLDEAAKTLKQAGAVEVWGLSMAKD